MSINQDSWLSLEYIQFCVQDTEQTPSGVGEFLSAVASFMLPEFFIPLTCWLISISENKRLLFFERNH